MSANDQRTSCASHTLLNCKACIFMSTTEIRFDWSDAKLSALDSIVESLPFIPVLSPAADDFAWSSSGTPLLNDCSATISLVPKSRWRLNTAPPLPGLARSGTPSPASTLIWSEIPILPRFANLSFLCEALIALDVSFGATIDESLTSKLPLILLAANLAASLSLDFLNAGKGTLCTLGVSLPLRPEVAFRLEACGSFSDSSEMLTSVAPEAGPAECGPEASAFGPWIGMSSASKNLIQTGVFGLGWGDRACLSICGDLEGFGASIGNAGWEMGGGKCGIYVLQHRTNIPEFCRFILIS